MKKTIKTITMVLMFTLLITACDKDKKNDVDTSTKANTDKGKGQVQTTIIEVTDSTGEPVTNAKGEKVTQVVTIPPTTKKDKSKQDTTTTTKSNTPTTTKAPPKNTTTRPVTQPQNPYGYVNAWGTLAQMEADCKAYAQSIGLIYKDDFNMGNGHWITPNSSYGASSPNDFKVKIFDGIEFNKSINTTTIRVLFVTLDNYKDGRCGEHLDVAEMYLRDDTDKISVYLITD